MIHMAHVICVFLVIIFVLSIFHQLHLLLLAGLTLLRFELLLAHLVMGSTLLVLSLLLLTFFHLDSLLLLLFLTAGRFLLLLAPHLSLLSGTGFFFGLLVSFVVPACFPAIEAKDSGDVRRCVDTRGGSPEELLEEIVGLLGLLTRHDLRGLHIHLLTDYELGQAD